MWSETISVIFRRNCWMLCSLLVLVLAVANLAQICQIWKIACRCQRVSFLKWVGKPENCHLCELNARIVCESQHKLFVEFYHNFFHFLFTEAFSQVGWHSTILLGRMFRVGNLLGFKFIKTLSANFYYTFEY